MAVIAAVAALIALLASAGAAQALPNRDVRAPGHGTGREAHAARAALRAQLGGEARVTTDRVTGAARVVARTDGTLTGPSDDDPAAIALGYVRAHRDVFGLAPADLAGLRLVRRYRSPTGVTELHWVQTAHGIAGYDNVLLAGVTSDGRLLSVRGNAVPGLDEAQAQPSIGAARALAVAHNDVRGSLLAPAADERGGAERVTRFSSGDHARLTIFSDGRSAKLAWRVDLTGADGERFEVLVDATSAGVLLRRSLTSQVANASVHDYYPGAPSGGTNRLVDLEADPTWLNRSSGYTRLRGNNAYAYADIDGSNGVGAGEDVTPSSGTNWIYHPTHFDVPGQACPRIGGQAACTWDSTNPGTNNVNRQQATTQLFYFVNRFHDHVKADPIGFTHESGGFEHADADGGGPGVGGDAMIVEANDPAGADDAKLTWQIHDGDSPRLEAYFFENPSLNAADAADIVYHEYGHAMTNRLVGSGLGFTAPQARALSEGWSDWYALDFLAAEGHIADTAAPGEVRFGPYFKIHMREQAIDCPVGAAEQQCPGTPSAGPGGFTLGDMGRVLQVFEEHADGEIWGQTLWDLRRALGSAVAARLITAGLRGLQDNPDFLEARDAILVADQALGGAHRDVLWQVFAARGMGFSATTPSADSAAVTEAFDLPPQLLHEATAVSDPPPGGDGDGSAEPGETVRLTETLRNDNRYTVGDVRGRLRSAMPGVVVVAPSATWPTVAPGATASGSPQFAVAIPASVACGTSVALRLHLETDHGPSSIPLSLQTGALGPTATSPDPQKQITGTPGASSTITFATPGTVSGLNVRLSVDHPHVGDLKMTLRSPQGTTVTLMDSPGAGEYGASGDDFSDLVLDDGASTPIEELAGANPEGGYTGAYRPDEPLSRFDGEQRLGAWKLTVVDKLPGVDDGALLGWGLVPSGRECSPSSNRAPVAADDARSATSGATLQAATVLGNDSDPEGTPLTAVQLTEPAHGTVALAEDGTFAYTPAAGFTGEDTFTYVAWDQTATSAPATVRIAVGPADQPAGGSSLARAARLQVLRAAVRGGRLDVLARLTTAARGRVGVTYTAAGRTARYRVTIRSGRVVLRRTLARRQRRARTGMLTLRYGGSTTVRPASVRLRAAPRAARLTRTRAQIDARGRLRVAGTITRRARGVIVVRLEVTADDGRIRTHAFRARIKAGRWALTRLLTSSARRGGELSILYAGDARALIGGEQIATRVA